MADQQAKGAPAAGDGDYDPFANRPPGSKATDFEILAHLFKGSVGTGVLFLPNAFRRAGYMVGLICGTLVGIVSTHTAVIYVRSSQVLCHRFRVPMLDFARTAELSVMSGPEGLHKHSRKIGMAVNTVLCLNQFQVCIIYSLYVATSIQQVVESFYDDFRVDVRIYLIAFCPFYCAVCLIRNLRYLAPFSVIGSILILAGIIVSCYYFFTDFPDPGRLNTHTTIMPIPFYCNIFLFALHNIPLYLPLENNMANPKRMTLLIAISMIVNTIVYLFYGFFGYNKYMFACDTVMKNLPMKETLAQAMKVAVALSIFMTFVLIYYVPATVLWPKIAARYNLSLRHEVLARILSVIFMTLVAVGLPEMVPLLGFFAAFSITTLVLLLPAMIETLTRWDEYNKCMLFKNFLLLMLYLFCLTVGAVEGLMAIIREYGGHKDSAEC